MRALSPQQRAMLARVAEDQHAIPHGWTGARRTGADRTRHSLLRAGLITRREPPNDSAPYVLTEKGRQAAAGDGVTS